MFTFKFNHMVNQLSLTFSALTDPTRRTMLERLCERPLTVGELSAPLKISKPAVSKHLRTLERAGLIRRMVNGRTHTIALAGGPLGEAADWLETYRRFWDDRLDALTDFLESEGADEEK